MGGDISTDFIMTPVLRLREKHVFADTILSWT